MEQEIWKSIRGFEGIYEISNRGRVRSLQRSIINRNGIVITAKEKIKKTSINKNGYACVTLCKDGKSKQYTLHRILAEAFIPNPDNKTEIDHINTIRSDFRLENLHWVTHSENMRNPISQSKIKAKLGTQDIKNKVLKTRIIRNRKTAPKKVYQFSIKGEFIAEYESSREAGRKTGFNPMSIAEASRGGLIGRQSCGGYLWSRSRDLVPKYEPYKKKFKPILQYTKDWEFVRRWNSIKEACETLGLSPSNINRNAMGRKKCLCGGYNWKYEH